MGIILQSDIRVHVQASCPDNRTLTLKVLLGSAEQSWKGCLSFLCFVLSLLPSHKLQRAHRIVNTVCFPIPILWEAGSHTHGFGCMSSLQILLVQQPNCERANLEKFSDSLLHHSLWHLTMDSRSPHPCRDCVHISLSGCLCFPRLTVSDFKPNEQCKDVLCAYCFATKTWDAWMCLFQYSKISETV